MSDIENKEKVLLVSPLPPPIGGIARWTVTYLEYLKRIDKKVSVVNSGVTGNRVKDTNKVDVASEIIRLYKIKSAIKKRIKSNEYQVLHYNASCFFKGLIRDYVVLFGIGKKVPIIYQCHCNLSTNVRSIVEKFVFRCVLKKVRMVIVLNENSYRMAKRFHNRVIKIPNFIEKNKCRKITVGRELKKILFVGRVCREKGMYELVDAAKKLPNIEFHIVGPDENGVIKDLELTNIIYHGEVKHEELGTFYGSMDLFLLPSYTEGFPIAVLEAMSFGLPIVATNVGSISEMIGAEGGILINKQSSAEIVSAIESLYDAKKRADMSEYNYLRVRNEYTDEIVINKLFDLYQSVK